ncbi:TPA_asm: hypothetical protein vir519_00056 [Caudoviricetes sp. vir519]|nr:TPA_asm: hypothetical protein vir519_00056 [Caudoviricetes sp. vir519]
MDPLEMANLMLAQRERIADSLPLNPHGWPILRKKEFNWVENQASLYDTLEGSPLEPSLITPRGTAARMNLRCKTAEKLYDKQQSVVDYSDCNTLHEHKTIWQTSEAVKSSILAYKTRDAFTFTKALMICVHGVVLQRDSDWRLYTKLIPFLDKLAVDFYSDFPQLETDLNIENIERTEMGGSILRHFWVIK